jgi:hypothetical protein
MPSGILVHGSNHLIVSGNAPTLEQARKLVKAWELPNIGPPPSIPGWSIKTREFRENLSWAVVLDNGEPQTSAVLVLLDELAARGVSILRGEGLYR